MYKPDPLMSLYEYLRKQKLFGARVSEQSGAFGSDIVTLVSFDQQTSETTYNSVNAYLTPLIACHGKHIITVEGIGNKQMLHPIQQQFLNCESFQCGYCAGGFTMAMYSLLRNNSRPKEADIMLALDGNMCRCTAYNPIASAVSAFATDIEDMPLCKQKIRYEPVGESPFPEELRRLPLRLSYEYEILSEQTGEQEFVVKYEAPTTIEELQQVAKASQYHRVVYVGGVIFKPLREVCDRVTAKEWTLIDLRHVLDFVGAKTNSQNFLEIGGMTTYTQLMEHLKRISTETGKRLVAYLQMFRNTPLRNTQSIGEEIRERGDNDFNLLLAAMEAKIEIMNPVLQETKVVDVIELLNNKMDATQIVSRIFVPKEPEFIYFQKRSRRHANMEAFVSAVGASFGQEFKVYVNNLTTTESVQIAKLNLSKEDLLKPENHHQMEEAVKGLLPFDNNDNQDARMYGKFKAAITANNIFLIVCKYKLFCNIAIDPEYHAVVDYVDKQFYGQNLKMPRADRSIPESSRQIVGNPVTSANLKAKLIGEPIYSVDLDEFSSRITHGAYVLTERPFGKVVSVNIDEAKKVPGFVIYVDERDIPNKTNGNAHSGISMDTPVFVKNGNILHRNQPIGLVTATTRDAAIRAAKLVKVVYDVDDKDILSQYTKKSYQLTIQEAMQNNSYYSGCGVNQRVLTLGDITNIDKADVVVEDENVMGGQQHIYLETQNCIVYPEENGYFKVYSSTQNPSKMQFDIAWNLNNPEHRRMDKLNSIKADNFIQNAQIEVETMALGGGFGGKQDRPMILCTAAAVAAFATNKPVKLVLERNVDNVIMGGRHPYYFKYKAGISKEGKYVGMDLLLVNDGGSTFDVSAPVLDKSIFQSQSCYTIPNIRVEGRSAKTNRVTNTAFRGFGAPQATYVQECIIDHLCQAWYAKCNNGKYKTFQEAAWNIRLLNLNKPGDLLLTQTLVSTRYAEHLTQTLLKTLLQRVDVNKKMQQVCEFNEKNKFIKRGIAISPLKNSVNFEENFMNEASALVHIYRDGSVAVNHSGTEMGQSLHTKMAMVCAEALQIPLEYVHVNNTNTSRCSNTQPTSASSGADLNGKAIKQACEELMENLKELKDKLKDKTWPELCNIAYFSRTKMSALSYVYHPAEIQWEWPEKKGTSGLYTAYGIGIAVVEVNGLTGEFLIKEAYVQKDVGSPLNPLVDCGQIEGGFGQGIGLLTTEEILWEQGQQLTTSKNYAFMGISDVPQKMSVEIQKDVPNPQNIYDSKASAESPTCLGAAVYLAIKTAIRELREADGKAAGNSTDKNGNQYLKTPAPLSYQKIFEAVDQK